MGFKKRDSFHLPNQHIEAAESLHSSPKSKEILMQNLTINPTFHDLIPPISTEEYQLLEESLIREGCREKIITWEGCILDGHNRFEICQKHDVPFGIHEMCFENETEAKFWIIRNQLARRNLPQHERVRLALLLKPAIEEKAKEKQKAEGKTLGGTPTLSMKSTKGSVDTRKEVAATAGVSEDTIRKSEIIEKEATPEVKDAARKGKISINKAYKQTRKPKAKKPSHLNIKDTETLSTLKINWQKASEKDRKQFLAWLRKRNEL
jgi:hypothetical protein